MQKALSLARFAADEGHVFEVPAVEPGDDGHRASEGCREWLSGKRGLPFRQCAFLLRVVAADHDGRSFLIVVDADDDASSFKFSTAKAFRTPNGRVCWASAMFGFVERGERVEVSRTGGGTDVQLEQTSTSAAVPHAGSSHRRRRPAKRVFDATKLH